MPLAGDGASVLLDWLAVRFGPTTKPFPRTYVAQEVTTFFTDSEAEALLKRACTSCHAIERVNDARFSPDRWRVVTVDMRERGAKLQTKNWSAWSSGWAAPRAPTTATDSSADMTIRDGTHVANP